MQSSHILDTNIANIYDDALPQKAQKFKYTISPHIEFDQTSFIYHVNLVKKSDFFNPLGICMGYQILSYAYSCFNLDNSFFSDLQTISRKNKFSLSQQNILDLLSDSQDQLEKTSENKLSDNNISLYISTQGSFVNIKNTQEILATKLTPEDIYYELEDAVYESINRSFQPIGCKVLIGITTIKGSHVTGLQVKMMNDKIILQYDDNNFHLRVNFDNAFYACSDITNQLFYRYYHDYLADWNKGFYPKISILKYQAEIDNKPITISKPKSWLEKQRIQFFSPPEVINSKIIPLDVLTVAKPIYRPAKL